jgi:hypothetical protein
MAPAKEGDEKPLKDNCSRTSGTGLKRVFYIYDVKTFELFKKD